MILINARSQKGMPLGWTHACTVALPLRCQWCQWIFGGTVLRSSDTISEYSEILMLSAAQIIFPWKQIRKRKYVEGHIYCTDPGFERSADQSPDQSVDGSDLQIKSICRLIWSAYWSADLIDLQITDRSVDQIDLQIDSIYRLIQSADLLDLQFYSICGSIQSADRSDL